MSFVKVKNNRVFREVLEFETAKKILDIISKKHPHDERVVETTIFSEEKKLLEHEYISPIIHSGEYTTSMALDVALVSVEMALEYLKSGIFMCDALPHNYTYYNGRWILYDFGAFELSPKNVKTFVRNIFKVTVSSLELLIILTRKELREYFLNRISHSKFSKMTNLKNFLSFTFKSQLCLLFCSLNFNKEAYTLAKIYLDEYNKKFKRKYFENNISECEKYLYAKIDNFIEQMSAKNTFCVGLNGAKWSVNSTANCNNFVYIDDYDDCDDFYNYIYKNDLKNISTAVVYPFFDDEKIDKDIRFRALYDRFAKERFSADVAIFVGVNEILSEAVCLNSNFLENLSDFANNAIFLSFYSHTSDLFITDFLKKLGLYFKNIKTERDGSYIYIYATDKSKHNTKSSLTYPNANRCNYADIHSEKLIELINKTSHKK